MKATTANNAITVKRSSRRVARQVAALAALLNDTKVFPQAALIVSAVLRMMVELSEEWEEREVE